MPPDIKKNIQQTERNSNVPLRKRNMRANNHHTQFRFLLNDCVGIDVKVCGNTDGVNYAWRRMACAREIVSYRGKKDRRANKKSNFQTVNTGKHCALYL